MFGSLYGILDAIGFALVASVLFLPLVVFGVYFLWEVIQWKRQEATRFVLEEPHFSATEAKPAEANPPSVDKRALKKAA